MFPLSFRCNWTHWTGGGSEKLHMPLRSPGAFVQKSLDKSCSCWELLIRRGSLWPIPLCSSRILSCSVQVGSVSPLKHCGSVVAIIQKMSQDWSSSVCTFGGLPEWVWKVFLFLVYSLIIYIGISESYSHPWVIMLSYTNIWRASMLLVTVTILNRAPWLWAIPFLRQGSRYEEVWVGMSWYTW